MPDLEKRVRKLELTNRLLAAIIGVGFVGALAMGAKKGSVSSFDILSVKKILLVGDDNKSRGYLGVADGGCALQLSDSHDRAVTLGCLEHGSTLQLSGSHNRSVTLGCFENGTASMSLPCGAGKAMLSLLSNANGSVISFNNGSNQMPLQITRAETEAGILFQDTKARTRMLLLTTPDGKAEATIFDGDRKTLWSAP